MNITLTYEHGAISADFSGEDREELQKELLNFAEFVEENQDVIGNLPHSSNSERANVHTPAPESADGTEEAMPENSVFSSISERTRIDESILSEVLAVPEEEPPHIKSYKFEEESEILGSSRKDQQARASAVLLYVWDECRDVSGVELSEMEEALSHSGIDPSRIDAMYGALDGKASNYFSKPGGKGGTLALQPGGEHAAREEIKNLAESYELQITT